MFGPRKSPRLRWPIGETYYPREWDWEWDWEQQQEPTPEHQQRPSHVTRSGPLLLNDSGESNARQVDHLFPVNEKELLAEIRRLLEQDQA